ncbi:MAG: hypothetical protein KBB55_02205 [Candidatus Buchananbacteria bacterium]|nr:hypothetical protein [Candidatus Buchananbacteria bacterium]
MPENFPHNSLGQSLESSSQEMDVVNEQATEENASEVALTPEQEKNKAFIINAISGGHIYSIDTIKEKVGLPESVMKSPEVREAILARLERYISSGYPDDITRAIRFKDGYEVSDAVLQGVFKNDLLRKLSYGNGSPIFVIRNTRGLGDLAETLFNLAEVQEQLREYARYRLANVRSQTDDSEIPIVQRLKDEKIIPEEAIREIAIVAMVEHVLHGKGNIAAAIKDAFALPEIRDVIELPAWLKSAVENWGISKWKDLDTDIDKSYLDYLLKTPDKPSCVSKETQIPQGLSLIDTEILLRNEYNLNDLKTEMGVRRALEILCASEGSAWEDAQNIAGPFERGASEFGHLKMFEYVKGSANLHQALHAFDRVITLYQQSGLAGDIFYANILAQVARDGARYETGTSHDQLNSIAQTLNTDITTTLETAREYQEIEQLQSLLKTFTTASDVFDSWVSLKRFSDLQQLLERSEILDELKELKKSDTSERLYHYIETLGFHPSSKVDMSAVMDFWKHPERFIAADDTHTRQDIQERKKPSNYTHIPHLDLTAIELRDALVEGVLDELQVFAPLEIHYDIPRNVEVFSIRKQLSLALGSRKEGVAGTAKQPPKLFSEINKVFKGQELSLTQYLQDESMMLAAEVEGQLHELLYDETIGIPKPEVVSYVAKINLKSDPNGVLAGNDTACCMPFGEGKNTVYTFNPDTSLFTLQIIKEGRPRTIAQSVLTKDKDIKKLIPEILRQLESDNTNIQDIIPESVLVEAKSYLTCDNVELAPNYKQQLYESHVEMIYRDFFREYLERYGVSQELNADIVPIGMGYSDLLTNLPKQANTFAPLAPVGYSDKSHAQVYALDVSKKTAALQREIINAPTLSPSSEKSYFTKGVDHLTFEDTLAVAYLEGKAYDDNQSLITYLHNIENALIAKDINNHSKGRPNMSLKYIDSNGSIRGYILAYEGRRQDDEAEAGDAGESIIYIADLAADTSNKLAGGKLIKSFAELYKREYLDQGNLTPIYAQAREQTSYAIIKKQLDALARDSGYEFKLEEEGTYQVGNDTMHQVMIRPILKTV